MPLCLPTRLTTDHWSLPSLPLSQIQMRDIPGFVETRYRLLQLRPNNRNNWVTWAVAHHLDGNYDMAVQIIRGYESTVVSDQPVTHAARAGQDGTSRVTCQACPAAAGDQQPAAATGQPAARASHCGAARCLSSTELCGAATHHVSPCRAPAAFRMRCLPVRRTSTVSC